MKIVIACTIVTPTACLINLIGNVCTKLSKIVKKMKILKYSF